MRKYKLREVAKKLGVGRATVYRLVKRHREKLGDTLETGPDGVQFLSERGVAILSRETGKKTAPETPGTGETGSETVALLREMLDNYKQEIKEKDELLKKVITGQQEERQRTDSIIFSLTNQIKEQSMMIEDLREQRQEVIIPEYYPEEVQEVQEDIMDVDKVEVAPVQAAPTAEVCKAPTVPVEQVRKEVVTEEQGAGPVEKAEPVKKTKEKKPHPKHSWGVLKRVWVNMFQPELLRET